MNYPPFSESRWTHKDGTELWSAWDGTSAELETSDFLYQLTKTIKPHIVFESGCYMGQTSYAIGKALQENGRGKLVTCDPMPECFVVTNKRIQGLPVEVYGDFSLNVMKNLSQIELAFIDSGDERVQEIKEIFPYMHEKGIIVVHDTIAAPHLLDSLDVHFNRIDLSTPRGLTLLQLCA